MNAPDFATEVAQGPLRPTRARMTVTSVAYCILAVVAAFLWLVADTVPSPLSDFGLAGPLQLVTGVAIVLAGAALHVRHPDAWLAHRSIAAGIALAAGAALLLPASSVVIGAGWAAAMFGGSGVIYVGFALSLVASVLGLISTGFLWLGISRSHLRVGTPGLDRVSIVIWTLAGLQLLNGIVSTSRGLGSGSPEVELIVLRGFAIGALQLLLGTGLTVTLVSGARSGELPNRAWRIAGGSRLIVLVGMLVYPLLVVSLGTLISGVEAYVLPGQFLALVGAFGFLGAFSLGLPAER